jgi:y4mF family transcriptional regulator
MHETSTSIGTLIRDTRKSQGLTQQDLALACGTGLRFIIDLEKGKPSCQMAKTLHVLQTLGIKINLTIPPKE